MLSLPLIPHTPTDTESKINYKNQKSTTKSTTTKNQPQNQQKKSTTGTKSLDRWCWWKSVMGWCWSILMEIDDGLTKISVDGDRCWWSACNGLMEKRKEKDSQKKKKEEEEGEADIEIRMVWRRGYLEEKEGCWWSACDGLIEKRKEKDSQKKKKKEEEEGGEERGAEIERR